MRRMVAVAVWVCTLELGHAAETHYSYDALGRLVQVDVSGGPPTGVQQTFQYDAAGNRTQQVIAPAGTPLTLSVDNTVLVASSTGVNLTVNISGPSASGTVTFVENGVFLGQGFVIDGQASILIEGLPNGVHIITAVYSGDTIYAPETETFTLDVRDLSWLPAVLDLLLSD